MLYVLLLCLFGNETNLPPLPPRPQAGVGSGPRIDAIKSSLKWLLEVFGSATPLHGLLPSITKPPKGADSIQEDTTLTTKTRTISETSVDENDDEAVVEEEEEDIYLDNIARGVVEGDEVATLSTVWAMWQGWALLKFVPLYAEATSHVGCSEREIVANLQAGEVHEGLREWLLCYFSELVRYGHKQLKQEVPKTKIIVEEIPVFYKCFASPVLVFPFLCDIVMKKLPPSSPLICFLTPT